MDGRPAAGTPVEGPVCVSPTGSEVLVRHLFPDRPLVYVLLAVMAATSAAVAVAVAATGVSAGPFLGRYPSAVAIFAVATTASLLIPVRQLETSGGRLVVHPTVAFTLSLTFLVPPLAAGAVAAGSIFVGCVLLRLPPRKTAFNTMNFAIAVMAGGLVLHGLGESAGLLGSAPPDVMWYLAASLAMVVAEGSDDLLTSAIISLSSGRPLASIARFILSREALLSKAAFVVMAPPMVVVAQRSAVLIAPLLLVGFALCHLHRVAAREEQSANLDPLTGLPNRRAFMERLEALGDDRRRRPVYALLLIDLDRFKAVNDSLGHDSGDQVLIEVARRLREVCRPDDLVARLGGDEFAVLVAGESSPDTVAGIAWRIHATLNQPMTLLEGPITIGASVGAAIADGDADVGDLTLNQADLAMYRAKRAGLGVEIAGTS